MSSIKRVPRTGQWRARYRDANGKEHAKHFSRKVDGQSWLDEVTAAVATGTYVDPKNNRVTLREYATEWQASHLGRAATQRIVDNALRLHILPRLGDRTIASLRRSDAQSLVTAMAATHAPPTVEGVYSVLARVLAAAVDDRIVVVTPCVRVKLPKSLAGEIRPATVAEVTTLADAVADRYRAAVITLAGSGLRIGELLGLKVSDVDFLRRTVRVERQRSSDTGKIGPPKTPKSARTVPLGQVVIDELAHHLAAYPSRDWLFTTAEGGPLIYRAWQYGWDAARAEVGLTTDTHDLRHFFASALISGGASVKQVQTVLGHSSAVTTLQIYAHLWPGDDDRTRGVIDNILGPIARGAATA
jgi:integrase